MSFLYAVIDTSWLMNQHQVSTWPPLVVVWGLNYLISSKIDNAACSVRETIKELEDKKKEEEEEKCSLIVAMEAAAA